MRFIGPLADGPLDIVGDIHGEIDALRALLAHLGYDRAGHHPDGRTLVFIGDLCDRGPDSPAVIRLARRLIENDRAQAVLGNHELNFLRQQAKDGAGWYQPKREARDNLKYAPYAKAAEAEIKQFADFFSTLPLALEREDLRVVHAAWEPEAVAAIRTQSPDGLLTCFERLEREGRRQLETSGVMARHAAEHAAWKARLEDPQAEIPFLESIAQHDAGCQMLNPIRVLTSGVERPGSYPFYSSGQWRFVERVRWWDDYQEDIPVVVGHYWRRLFPVDRTALGKGDPDLFEGIAPLAWHGARQNVFCVDYSVGGRWQERKANQSVGSMFRLAALRWPEKTLVFDTGESQRTVANRCA